MQKSTSPDEFNGFIEIITGYNIDRLKNHYEKNIKLIEDQIRETELYKQLRDKTHKLDAEYYEKNEFHIVDFEKTIQLDTKKFNNMMNKCYRLNVLENTKWTSMDDALTKEYKWITPLNCYEELPDIIRTRITIRYIDVIDELKKIIKSSVNYCGYKHRCQYKAQKDGYYGVHFDIKCPISILDMDNSEKKIIINFEIQVTTQIKDVVNELLHEYYEKNRLEKQSKNWEWDYQNYNFLPNYLGHISHYIEGMILQARDKLRGE